MSALVHKNIYVSQGGCVFIGRLFVSGITQKNHSTDFHKIMQKGDTLAMEETVRFGGHITFKFRARVGLYRYLYS